MPSCELQKDCSIFNWADFSLYINESLFARRSLSCVQNFCTTADHRVASNFWLRDIGIGSHITRHNHGIKDWNNTQFTNFKFIDVKSHSVHARNALWTNFVINGNLTDLDFSGSTLDTGLFFNGKFKESAIYYQRSKRNDNA